jgi:hypothetical protein
LLCWRDEGNVFDSALLCRGIDAAHRLRYGAFGQRFLARELHDQVVQHVQVVTFSEKVLRPLEFRTPRIAFFRQKTLDHVAEALHADPQLVPGFRTRLLRPTLVELYDVT